MGINLEIKEVIESQSIYYSKRLLIEKLKRKGETSPFIKCDVCDGTGLADVHHHESGASWGGQYCSKCNGQGLFDYFEDMIQGKGLLNGKK